MTLSKSLHYSELQFFICSMLPPSHLLYSCRSETPYTLQTGSDWQRERVREWDCRDPLSHRWVGKNAGKKNAGRHQVSNIWFFQQLYWVVSGDGVLPIPKQQKDAEPGSFQTSPRRWFANTEWLANTARLLQTPASWPSHRPRYMMAFCFFKASKSPFLPSAKMESYNVIPGSEIS